MQPRYFGEPWPSGICEEGVRVPVPVGEMCWWCEETITEDACGSFMLGPTGMDPMHRECALRSTLGGIGHLEDHHFWCVIMGDPDGGRTKRYSALEVWAWVNAHGIPA